MSIAMVRELSMEVSCSTCQTMSNMVCSFTIALTTDVNGDKMGIVKWDGRVSQEEVCLLLLW